MVAVINTNISTVIFRDPRLNLVQLFFLTGICANYSSLSPLNNLFGILLIAYTLFSIGNRQVTVSPLISLYAALTAISVLNHLALWSETRSLEPGMRTMPFVLLMMISCRVATQPGIFKRAVLLNTIPLLFLLILGGVGISTSGRLSTDFLTEYMHGFYPQFAFAIGINMFIEGRFRLLTMASFLASSVFMSSTSSRQYLAYIIGSIAVLLVSGFRFNLRRLTFTILILTLVLFVIVPRMNNLLAIRNGGDFNMIQHASELITGTALDNSSQQRLAMMLLSLEAAKERWLGYGHANFPYVVESLDNGSLNRVPSHPHSSLAEVLITGGYPGLVIYICILLYLTKMFYKDPIMRICLVWLYLTAFVGSSFIDKILWPLMAIAEREFEIRRSRQTAS